jgi:hypothetical protein
MEMFYIVAVDSVHDGHCIVQLILGSHRRRHKLSVVAIKSLESAPWQDAKLPLFGVLGLDIDQHDVMPVAVQPLAQEHVSYAVGIGSQAFLILVEDKPTVVQREGGHALLDLLNNAYTLSHTFVAGLWGVFGGGHQHIRFQDNCTRY